MTKDRVLIFVVWLATSLCVAVPVAADRLRATYSIRVESDLVVVPAFVFDKGAKFELATVEEKQCLDANREAFDKLGSSEPFLPKDCDSTAVRGLTARDFHVFEDGVASPPSKLRCTTSSRVSGVMGGLSNSKTISKP